MLQSSIGNYGFLVCQCQVIFSSVIKDIKGSKPKQVPEVENEGTKESIEELSVIFSTANFVCDVEDHCG